MAKAFISGVGAVELQEKVVDITKNGTIEILPDTGKVLGKVTANVNAGGPEYSKGLLYEYYEFDNSVRCAGRGSCTDEVIRIPEKATVAIPGKYPVEYVEGTVAHFGYNAFEGDEKVVEVHLPTTFTNMGALAFGNCPNLKRMYMPGVTYFASFELSSLPSLVLATFGKDLYGIGGGFANGGTNTLFDFTDCTMVPDLDSYGAGKEFGTDPVILVPAHLKEEWKNATNWTLYADYIVSEGYETWEFELEDGSTVTKEVYVRG